MYKQISNISFPEYRGNLKINMMPIIFGDEKSIPKEFHDYLPIIQKCNLEKGKLAYLTIHESLVKEGETQRRPGIHTEGTKKFGWGDGSWGNLGVYMANNDGSCKIWNSFVNKNQVDEHGSLLSAPEGISEYMEANMLYWLTDRTPHEAMSTQKDTNRQFFRLVSNEIGVWWKQHSTENPFGIQPNCKILTHSKF